MDTPIGIGIELGNDGGAVAAGREGTAWAAPQAIWADMQHHVLLGKGQSPTMPSWQLKPAKFWLGACETVSGRGVSGGSVRMVAIVTVGGTVAGAAGIAGGAVDAVVAAEDVAALDVVACDAGGEIVDAEVVGDAAPAAAADVVVQPTRWCLQHHSVLTSFQLVCQVTYSFWQLWNSSMVVVGEAEVAAGGVAAGAAGAAPIGGTTGITIGAKGGGTVGGRNVGACGCKPVAGNWVASAAGGLRGAQATPSDLQHHAFLSSVKSTSHVA